MENVIRTIKIEMAEETFDLNGEILETNSWSWFGRRDDFRFALAILQERSDAWFQNRKY